VSCSATSPPDTVIIRHSRDCRSLSGRKPEYSRRPPILICSAPSRTQFPPEHRVLTGARGRQRTESAAGRTARAALRTPLVAPEARPDAAGAFGPKGALGRARIFVARTAARRLAVSNWPQAVPLAEPKGPSSRRHGGTERGPVRNQVAFHIPWPRRSRPGGTFSGQESSEAVEHSDGLSISEDRTGFAARNSVRR
jgi:hypothetical protein